VIPSPPQSGHCRMLMEFSDEPTTLGGNRQLLTVSVMTAAVCRDTHYVA